MKRFMLTLLAMQGIWIAMAQPLPTTINGQTSRYIKEPVKLFSISNGRLEEMASSRPTEDGKFGFLFYPESEGFYVVGMGTSQITADKYMFYFKPGDNLNVSINDTSYSLTGKNTAENLAIEHWHNKGYELERPATYYLKSPETFVEYFPKVEAFTTGLASYKPLPVSNKKFEGVFARMRKTDVLAWALYFMGNPNSIHPAASDYTSFYKNFKPEDYTADAFLFQYPFGARLITWFSLATDMIAGNKLSGETANRIARITNDTLKGEIVVSSASSLKTLAGYYQLQEQYGKYILTPDQKRRAADVMTKLAKETSKPGQSAINFSYPDNKGQQVSLASFKGKVVLIDVWATWCGPCKAELPHLKKLEEEMKEKEVAFVSISVDAEKDLQKWKDFIVKESLGGIQLFAGPQNDVSNSYDIKTIPRFLVFDKKGNIVSVDAPRPSGSELKLLLENELKK